MFKAAALLLAAVRMDLGARVLEMICDRLTERAEASWNWPADLDEAA